MFYANNHLGGGLPWLSFSVGIGRAGFTRVKKLGHLLDARGLVGLASLVGRCICHTLSCGSGLTSTITHGTCNNSKQKNVP